VQCFRSCHIDRRAPSYSRNLGRSPRQICRVGTGAKTPSRKPGRFLCEIAVVQEVSGKSYLRRESALASYSESLRRFLPDRFVEGSAQIAAIRGARRSCDNCGTLHDPSQLRHPHSTLDAAPVTFRQTEHFVLALDKLEPKLREWLNSRDRSYWRTNTFRPPDLDELRMSRF